MQSLPTGVLVVLAMMMAGGSLACKDSMVPKAMPSGQSHGCPWLPNRYAGLDDSHFLPMDPAEFSRAWIDPEGQVIGFMFFTQGCELCEDRQGRMALYRRVASDRYGYRNPRVVLNRPSGQQIRSIMIITNG